MIYLRKDIVYVDEKREDDDDRRKKLGNGNCGEIYAKIR